MSADSLAAAINTVWTMVAAFLVFIMQAGFAMVEAGFTRAKNAGNIVLKNLMDFSVASIAYWAVGFAVMFGASAAGVLGTSGFFLGGGLDHVDPGVPLLAFVMFQTVFAGTAATIVSGAMAERTRFTAYLAFSAILSALIYPIVGHWVWGGGWLGSLGMLDFAGSTVVHSVGAWAALVGIALVGPRAGRFGPNGQVRPIPGHNLILAALGVFILWFGWFGFNAGSTLAGTDANIGRIALTTNLAAASGAATALFLSRLVNGHPGVAEALNGALAGLVAITAGCAFVSPAAAVLIGAGGGLLLLPGSRLLERLHLDDAVGAVPVHGIAGAWGTLAVGLFHEELGLFTGGGAGLLAVQALGVAAVFLFVGVTSWLAFLVCRALLGLRVSPDEEARGLDLGEHGVSAYPEFAVNNHEPASVPSPASVEAAGS
ncbi:MAG: ammonium transporter [Thermaerobacter sp.]|nr:ammonium transporter [Bacillota bacterium]REJ36858.1 MAG: ammonium transporter [Bacillota bacterium]